MNDLKKKKKFISFAYRMLADDLKLSSDDDDTPRVGGALQCS